MNIFKKIIEWMYPGLLEGSEEFYNNEGKISREQFLRNVKEDSYKTHIDEIVFGNSFTDINGKRIDPRTVTIRRKDD